MRRRKVERCDVYDGCRGNRSREREGGGGWAVFPLGRFQLCLFVSENTVYMGRDVGVSVSRCVYL